MNHNILDHFSAWNDISFHLFDYFGRRQNNKYIQDGIGYGFWSMGSEYYMGLCSLFCPRRTNIQHETPNYGPVNYKFEVDYYIQTYFSPEKLALIRKKLEKEGQKVMYSHKGFNSIYMEFAGYETHDKLPLTSGQGCRNTNTISKQGIQKRNMNMKYY